MKSSIATALVLATTAAVLAGCGSKTDPNKKNFGTALSQYFDQKGDLCLYNKKWPVQLDQNQLKQTSGFGPTEFQRMTALESVGLVKAEDVDVPVKSMFGPDTGQTYKARSYSLTDAAKPYLKEREVEVMFSSDGKKAKEQQVCWGKKALDEVVKWEGPMKFGEYQEARVTYTYKIDKLAEWAKNTDVQARFPEIKKIIDDAGKQEAQHAVKLTSEGWEPLGLDSRRR